MAVTFSAPNKILLFGGPDPTLEGTLAASEAITPGMLVERFNNSGVVRFRKSTRTGLANTLVMLDQPLYNKGIDDACAANDLIEVHVGKPGDILYMIIASGANIAAGARLTDAGNGKLKAVGSDVACFEARETVNNSAGPGDARIRVEVV